MVALSGLDVTLVVLLIAGAAAATKDGATEQRQTAQIGTAEEGRMEEMQMRRAKRGGSKMAFDSSEEEEEPFWAARGRRARLEETHLKDSNVPYALRWVFPQKRAIASSEEDESPFWASRGRRCCDPIKGDLKRGYGKDRVRALVAKIIAGSGGPEAEDEDVFWAARGKRRPPL